MQDAQSKQGLLITAPEPDTGDSSDQESFPPGTRSLDFEAKQGLFIHQTPGKSASREAMEKGPLQKLEDLGTFFTC